MYQFSKLPYSARPGLLSFEGQTHHSSNQTKQSAARTTASKTMTAKMGWLRHVLTVLSVVIFVSDFTILFGFEASLALKYVYVAAIILPIE